NAGILRDRTIRNMTQAEWQAVIDTNLSGVFYGCKYGMEIMADGGRIVNVSSASAFLGTFGQANYAAAKAGVAALTRVVSRVRAGRLPTSWMEPAMRLSGIVGPKKPRSTR